MKKIYETPYVDVMDLEIEALLEASLPMIDDDASGPGMSRDIEDQLLAPELPKFLFE